MAGWGSLLMRVTRLAMTSRSSSIFTVWSRELGKNTFSVDILQYKNSSVMPAQKNACFPLFIFIFGPPFLQPTSSAFSSPIQKTISINFQPARDFRVKPSVSKQCKSCQVTCLFYIYYCWYICEWGKLGQNWSRLVGEEKLIWTKGREMDRYRPERAD